MVYFMYITESWRDNPEFAQYLAELSSFGVDKLSKYISSTRTQAWYLLVILPLGRGYNKYKDVKVNTRCNRFFCIAANDLDVTKFTGNGRVLVITKLVVSGIQV